MDQDKEPFDYDRFVTAYNECVDRSGGWYFILDDDKEVHSLEVHYALNDYVRTVAEYGQTIYSSEQGEGADDIPLKYKKTSAGSVLPMFLRNRKDES